jgi:hypothetical protein
MNTKECRHCKQPIHVQARVCQHCKSNQGWLAGQSDPRFTLVWVGLIVVMMVLLSLWLPRIMESSDEPRSSPMVVVSATSVRYAATTEGTRVFALGEIRNESGIEASRIWLRLELFDASDRLIDTLMQEQSGLIVPPSGTKPYRLTGLTSVSPKDVKRAVVTVERARARERYD